MRNNFRSIMHADIKPIVNKDTGRVVVRYGDHPLIRGLYQDWHAVEHETKNQAGNAVPELLFSNVPFRIKEVG